MPLSILSAQIPDCHPNLTSRSLYRTSQPPAVRLAMVWGGWLAVSPVTQVSRVQPLCADCLASDALIDTPLRSLGANSQRPQHEVS